MPPGPEGRDFRYRSYEDLQADGLSVDRKNYQLVYTAPLDKDTTLDEIYRRFNIEHPSDYKGHSLSTGDIVVFRQDGKQTATMWTREPTTGRCRSSSPSRKSSSRQTSA